MPDLTESRDLLIRIETKLERCIQDISELRDHTSKRVDALERDKLDKLEADRLLKEAEKTHDDFESRIRFIEKYCWLGLGAVGLIQIIGFVYLIEKL